MGSLQSNGEPISHNDKAIRNLGHEVELSSTINDVESEPVRFLPDQISNIALWLDSKDLGNIKLDLSGNSKVMSWENKLNKPTSLVFTSPDGHRPTLHDRGILLNPLAGVNTDALIARAVPVSEPPLTMFVAITPLVSTELDYIFTIGGGGWWGLGLNGNLSPKSAMLRSGHSSGGGTSASTSTGITVGNSCIITGVVRNFVDRFVWLNGGGQGTSSTSRTVAPTNSTIGGFDGSTANRFNGYIHEIIVYSKELSTEERQRVEEYLSSKWNVVLDG